MASVVAGVTELGSLHRDELPVITVRMQGELQYAEGVVIVGLAPAGEPQLRLAGLEMYSREA